MSVRGTAWGEHAARELARRGHRAGGARADVIGALAADGGCCTAAQLASQLRASGRTIATASVYRALGTLHEAGLLHASDLGDGERRYELVHADGDHHHHAICERCGATRPFSDEQLEHAVRRGYAQLPPDQRRLPLA